MMDRVGRERPVELAVSAVTRTDRASSADDVDLALRMSECQMGRTGGEVGDE
jgi:hypothetical protein